MNNFKPDSNRSFKAYAKGNGEGKGLRISIRYELGGMNYFSGGSSSRGYYIGVDTTEWSISNGFRSESCMLFDGLKMLLVKADRYNKSMLQKIANGMDEIVPKMIELYDAKVDHSKGDKQELYKEILNYVRTYKPASFVPEYFKD